MKRREFLSLLMTAVVGGLVAACGNGQSEDEDGTLDNNSAKGSCSPKPTISGNHGHTLSVSAADIQAGVSKTYSIKGSSGHSHSITISSSQFAQLKSLKSITVTSTSGSSHTHSVTVSCA